MQQVIYGRVVDAIVGSDPRTPQFFSTPAGESGQIGIFVADTNVGAYVLGPGKQLQLVITDNSGNTVLSKQGVFLPTAGGAYFPLDVGDTLSLLGGYRMVVWLTDTNVTPQKMYLVVPATSTFFVSQSLGNPLPPVTVCPAQTPLAVGPQGTPGLVWRRLWSATTAYAVGAAVQYLDPNGGLPALISSFICLVGNTNVPPLDSSGALSPDWDYIAQRGAGSSDGGAYSPANAGEWSPVPTTQQSALNQLASVLCLNTLSSSPIPTAGAYAYADPQPTTPAAQLDRLAAVVYAEVLDTSAIPAAGSFAWASPTPTLVADQLARLAYVVYSRVLDGAPIPIADGGAYTPAAASQWFSPPTTQQSAINMLATALGAFELDGAPIPLVGAFTWANPQPASVAAQLDRLAAVVFGTVIDGTKIPASGPPFSWASPTPVLVADQIARLAYLVFITALNSTPIP